LEINASQRILQKITNPYNVVPGEAISGRSGLIYYFLENFMISLMAKIRQEHQSIAEKVAELSLETREFLSVTTAKRQEQAEKQAQELQAFYAKRQEQAEKQAQELQAFYKDLQETSQQFLSETAQARIAQAEKQAQELLAFHKELQETSQQFLSATADARTAQAKEQKESLLKFRQDLFVSIFG
jgi:gas vesicle GvpC-like protein